MQVGAVNRKRPDHRDDLEMAVILIICRAVGETQCGMCQAADRGQHTASFDLLLAHQFLDRIEQIVARLQAKCMGLHAASMQIIQAEYFSAMLQDGLGPSDAGAQPPLSKESDPNDAPRRAVVE